MLNILIVEDDPRIAEINRRFVEKVPGYGVIGIATTRQQAQEQLEVLRPELVLLDIFFPDMNGLDFLRWMHEHHRETDVIMITAAKEVNTVREAIRGGVFDFIVKPLVFERFEQTLLRYQEYRSQLQHLKTEHSQIDQAKIDQLIGGGQKLSKESYLPKGIDSLTLEKVSAVITQYADGLTAEAVGREIGASRSTARRYLEYLVAQGAVSADLSYGVVGRPERVYRKRKEG
ncbi:two-component system CitB family response regulator [Tumebacillus sp. BK434]|uniref:response regulator n=1 Tax=Tumebacillus sp. BK434 TaxID=2512169 RepID=UPI001047ACD4|nr:response regulator [Tumebacillus sp. BK434]TCP52171.1 two-component system CitB family response regulator [Tumebacillus sp. BK434]